MSVWGGDDVYLCERDVAEAGGSENWEKLVETESSFIMLRFVAFRFKYLPTFLWVFY